MLFEYYLWLYPVHFPSCSLCSLNKSLTFISHTSQTHCYLMSSVLPDARTWLSILPDYLRKDPVPQFNPGASSLIRKGLRHESLWNVTITLFSTLQYLYFQKLKTSAIGEYEGTCHMYDLRIVFISSLSKTPFSAILVTFKRTN